MLVCMKRQLTECRRRTNKNFGFGTILCSFFFERVPSLSPRETVRGHIASFPAVCRWVFYCLDRVEEGPKRPSTTNSSTGGHVRSQS
jgi:hypothetical protein